MKILVALCVYNELPYLPVLIDYYTNQGCEMLFVDNMSTDGTYEYLVERGMKVSRLDTNESWNLIPLIAALDGAIKKEQPDWVVHTGADLYYSFDNTIKEEIMVAESEGYDQLAVRSYYMHNTGEVFRTPLQNNYLWGMYRQEFIMIGKFKEGFSLRADNITFAHPRIKPMNGWIFNYGGCKPAEEQEVKLQRRQKAWDEGLPIAVGWHHLEGKRRNWIWDKKDLIYIPDYPEVWNYLKKIIVR